MSTRRRSRSRSRDKKIAPAKLRMDTKPQAIRITDPSLPAGRRREIDNVMKKARAQKSPNSGVFWDKKLLEVEAKDPNRWRHSGYKSLYIDGSPPSPGSRRSRSRSPPAGSSAAAAFGRRSPPSATMRRRSPRSPPPRFSRSPSPRAVGRRRSPPLRYRSRSPPPGSARASRPMGRPRSPPSPREPPSSRHPKRRSVSNSSISSCSDDSCSVCSPKGHRNARSRSRSPSPRMRRPLPKAPPSPPPPKQRTRPRPPSPPPARRPGKPPTTPPPQQVARKQPPKPSPSDRPTDPRRQPPPPRPRGSTGELISVKGVRPPTKAGAAGAVRKEKSTLQPMLLKRIKKERTGKRPGSPNAGDSSGSEDSGTSLMPKPIVATTSLTLSERFGKIAQWSADRERRDMENMRITKTGSNMKVLVEEEFLYGSPPRSLSPVPTGQFPDKLLSSSQSRTAAWDDVRVRYQYYKDLGYLRDLSLDDYVKWEEWWYKYQDWLANERHYEHWLTSERGVGGGGRRRGKKRLPASQRLN
ncbi:unnamed protein product [Phaedon cochleariae]|uniref:Serine/arginine repetitive matrix protein 1 n=1 Tax=Phaedon cochleariae TaxID=80249 RepID=A0A9N9SG14_PHACE|nr:unnamed protein product [Phaedon cochleariae]